MSRFLLLLLMVLSLALVACGDDEDEGADDNNDAAPLMADAGDDFMVTVGDVPTFDACLSTGNIENYSWTVLTPPEAVADDAGKPIREIGSDCRFTLEDAMAIEEAGEWVIQLEVRSGDETQTDTVIVTVMEPDAAPEAEATSEATETAAE